MSEGYKCGYVAQIGRPNAGKSTLLNNVLGSKLAITSAKPQTTRNRIAGIHTDEQMQVILVDTPGIHEAWTELNKVMVDAAMSALDEVDLVLWVGDMTVLAKRVEAEQDVLDNLERSIAERLEGKKVLFVANKMDVVPKPLVLPVIAAVQEATNLLAAVPISALSGDGVPTLCRKILEYGGVPNVVTECLAQGVENLQIEYGLDTDGDGDPNVFIPNPTPAQIQMAVAAQIFVLARSADTDVQYTNEKTYTLSNAPAFTPNDNFYRIDTALVVPKVDTQEWTLTIDGMVDTPLSFTYEELIEQSTTVETVTIACVSNEVGGDLVGNAEWQGIPLSAILEQAGVNAQATQIFSHSVDGFTAGMPTEVALDGRTALIATAMNGSPLPTRHGFPARLIVSGLYGYVSATKWLSRLELTTWEAADGYWIPRGWSKEAPIKITSRIDVPQRTTISAGLTPIAGIALSPSVGIAEVHVSIDDGPWQRADLADATNDNTWVQWSLGWEATPGDHNIRVRATDRNGVVQDGTPRSVAPDGATGYHQRRVTVR